MPSPFPRTPWAPQPPETNPHPFQSLADQPSRPQSIDPQGADATSLLSTGNELLLQKTHPEEDSGTSLIPSEPAQPILIPTPTTPFARRDPDRVPTPLSGRGDRKGHLFPVNDSSPTKLSFFPGEDAFPRAASPIIFTPSPRRPPSISSLYAGSKLIATMHGPGNRYTPTSPLSPRIGGGPRPLSPQPNRSRGPNSRPMKIPIPKYHPLHFNERRGDSEPSNPSPQIPVIKQPQLFSGSQSTRWMKERQRELIDKAKLSSRIAASPHGIKPDAPRLDPLGSPKGPMTPLALEEGGDYFQIAGSENNSPAVSPASRTTEPVEDVESTAGMIKASNRDATHR